MKFWEKIKEINNFNLRGIFPGYKFNNLIFRICIAVIAAWLVLAAASTLGVKGAYLKCPEDAVLRCNNPFYSPDGICSLNDPIWCSQEWIQPGIQINDPPSFFYSLAGTFSLSVMVLGVLLNHFLYNRGYKMPEERQ